MNTLGMFFKFQLEQRKPEAIPALRRLTNFITILLKNSNTSNYQSGTFKLIKKLASWKLSVPNIENLMRKLNFSMFSRHLQIC